MIAANMYNSRPRTPGRRGRKGLCALALIGVSLAAVMALMVASADQTPYGATQVWSAEPSGGAYTAPAPVTESGIIGGNANGQDTGRLPAATFIQVGAR